tara:strand:- start:428 stop:634 length:207 start_codon:yes stop_codon:yes gene_type:complete
VYSFENDPLYPKAYLTIDQIELAEKKAKRLRAKMFLSILERLFSSYISVKQAPAKKQQVRLSSNKGFA